MDGVQYICTNNKVADEISDKEKKTCLWHRKECTDRNHLIHIGRKIEKPNALGMCLRCYAFYHDGKLKKYRKPKTVLPLAVPGVQAISQLMEIKKASSPLQDMRGMSRESGVCSWKALDDKKRIYKCKNLKLFHSESGWFFPECGYHLLNCCKTFDATLKHLCPPIEYYNEYGLCEKHFYAKIDGFGYANTISSSKFTVPGVVKYYKVLRVQKKLQSHPLAPQCSPTPVSIKKKSQSPPVNVDPSLEVKTTSLLANFAKSLKRKIHVQQNRTYYVILIQRRVRGMLGRKKARRRQRGLK